MINKCLFSLTTASSIVIIIFAISLSNSVNAEKFACNRIFKRTNSLFLFKTKDIAYNKLPMILEGRRGSLFFNICEEIQLTNICGDVPVVGKFIFMDNSTQVGLSKCKILKSFDKDGWKFETMAEEENGLDSYGGVILKNDKMVLSNSEKLSQKVLERLDTNSYSMEHDNEVYEELLKDQQQIEDLHIKNEALKKMGSASQILNKGSSLDILDEKTKATSMMATPNPIRRSVSMRLEKMRTSYFSNKLNGISEIKTQMIFFCNNSDKPLVTGNYILHSHTLLIKIFSKDGCQIQLSMLQKMDSLFWLTAILMMAFGICYGFGGLIMFQKTYYGYLSCLFAAFTFFLYFMFVESGLSRTVKIFSTLAVVVISLLFFTVSLIYERALILFAAITSGVCLGLLAKSLFAEEFSFFMSSSSEWLLIILFFAAAVFIFLVSSKFFFIINTATVGSFFAMLSLKYLTMTDYDYLLNLQTQKFKEFRQTNPENCKFVLVYFILTLLMVLAQWFIYRKISQSRDKNKNDIDMLNTSGTTVKVNLDNI